MKRGCTCQLHQLIDAEAQWPHQLLINLGGLFLRPAGSGVPVQLVAHACKINNAHILTGMWALSCLLLYNVWPAVGCETAKLGVRGLGLVSISTAEALASSSGCSKSVSGSQAIAMSSYRQRTWVSRTSQTSHSSSISASESSS